MKSLLSFIWEEGLLRRKGLRTTKGDSIEIISIGEENKHGVFEGAIIKIRNKTWNGDVVLHEKSSDWERDIISKTSHHRNAILHIILNDNIETLRRNGEAVHQLRIKYPATLQAEYDKMVREHSLRPCIAIAKNYGKLHLNNYLSRLYVERMEEKVAKIKEMYNNCDRQWNDVLFKLLARSFGFGIQSRAFEEWANVLDMRALGKHKNSIEQIEAILFGQAGLLNTESIPTYYRKSASECEYYTTLTREYKFLKNKFNLSEVDCNIWNYGNSAPHIRISRLGALFYRQRADIASIIDCHTNRDLRMLLQVQPSWYWQHHTQFGSTTTVGTGDISNKQLDILIINAVIPMLYSYGKHRYDYAICNKAEDLLHETRSEENSITRKWEQQGVHPTCAADSQALIQLNNAYCNKNRCCYCRFAQYYFKEQIAVS